MDPEDAYAAVGPRMEVLLYLNSSELLRDDGPWNILKQQLINIIKRFQSCAIEDCHLLLGSS
jgi:hypothetical protein